MSLDPQPVVVTSQCKKYFIRLPKGNGWAAIYMDVPSGSVAIHSDFGNWAYHWCSIGDRNIQQFLIDCDNDYLMKKFGGSPNHFEFEKTVTSLKTDIQDRGRYGDLSPADVEKYLAAVDRLSYATSVDDFYHQIMSDRDLEVAFDPADVPYVLDHDPGIKMFFEKIWSVFIHTLRQEIVDQHIGG